jgi:hypothetical protein
VTTGNAGANTLRFGGRLGKRTLRRGAYTLVLSASASGGGMATAAQTTFRIR